MHHYYTESRPKDTSKQQPGRSKRDLGMSYKITISVLSGRSIEHGKWHDRPNGSHQPVRPIWPIFTFPEFNPPS